MKEFNIGALIIRIGSGVYDTIIIIRKPESLGFIGSIRDLVSRYEVEL